MAKVRIEKMDETVKESVVTDYVNGETLKQIATKLGVTSPTIASFLRKKGVTVRAKGKRKQVKDDGIVAPMIVPQTVEEVVEDTLEELDTQEGYDTDDAYDTFGSDGYDSDSGME